jgi:hypothetical protein
MLLALPPLSAVAVACMWQAVAHIPVSKQMKQQMKQQRCDAQCARAVVGPLRVVAETPKSPREARVAAEERWTANIDVINTKSFEWWPYACVPPSEGSKAAVDAHASPRTEEDGIGAENGGG